MKISDAIIKSLENEKVETIFGYPGKAVLPIYNSLRGSMINHVLTRHEQSSVHAASGYAIATNKVGVCLATSGPGATNLITGIANAFMDSIPLVIITGQVSTEVIGTDSYQEADIIGATEPFTKHNYLIKDKNEVVQKIKEAFHIASSGRKGPVLLDIPVDIQDEMIEFFDYSKPVDIKGYEPTYDGHDQPLEKAYEKIISAKKPLICIGGGTILSNAEQEVRSFVEKTQIPAVHTLKGKGALLEDVDTYHGLIGSYGNKSANIFVEHADLLIVVGLSVSNRTTANSNFNIEGKNIIHIDIDPAEVGKNSDSYVPIIGDAKAMLNELNKFKYDLNLESWMAEIEFLEDLSGEYPNQNSFVESILNDLSDVSDDDCIYLADVGINQIWAAHACKINKKQKFITSGRLRTMGFSIPAAIGAKYGFPKKQIIAIIGDGGFQMTSNELITIAENDLDIKIILIDDAKLGKVEYLQMKKFGNTFESKFIKNPDFKKLCEANYIDYMEIKNYNDIQHGLAHKGPILLHLKVEGASE